MPRPVTIGFSPCPNDTFIFDALVNGKIDTGTLRFEPVLEDVETLNEWAFQGKLDITKLSFRALLDVLDTYALLQSGSALGQGCGPLLISRDEITPGEVAGKSIAIPGVHTTANMLLGFAFPDAVRREAIVFSEIEDAVLDGHFDMGLIIHENRFTYAARGLKKVMDLGAYWESKTGCPIPLGGIAIKKDIPREVRRQTDALIRESLAYSHAHYPELSSFVTDHAQAMEESVMRSHISLYVNDFTRELGERGKKAILTMGSIASDAALVTEERLFG